MMDEPELSGEAMTAMTALQAANVGAVLLARKILRVMEETHAGGKDGKNSFHNYEYHSEAKLTAIVKAALIQNGIACYTSIDRVERAEIVKKDGKVELLTEVFGSLTFVCADTGHSHTVNVYGQGIDAGDKGGNKANTGAFKYALMRSFFLSDRESEPDSDANETAAPEGQATSNTKRLTNGTGARKGSRAKASAKAADAPEPVNGSNGQATQSNAAERQYDRELIAPERLREGMKAEAAKEPEAAPPQLQEQAVIALTRLMSGDEQKRRALTSYLFDTDTTKGLTKGACKVLLRWINIDKNHVPCSEAVAEAGNIITAALVKG